MLCKMAGWKSLAKFLCQSGFEEEKLVNTLQISWLIRYVLLELKSARSIESSHEAQLLHYLRATDIEVGLLLNFGVRPQFRRLLFDNERKKIRGNPCESVAEVSA